jgi:hypothetical protein
MLLSVAVLAEKYTGTLAQYKFQRWEGRTYGHDSLECSRIWSLVYPKASESVIVPQVVDAESGELEKAEVRKGGSLISG